jgi:DNA-directed RNA polymerase specialized sigma subunit
MSCEHYKRKLNNKDRHFIQEENYNNCVLCLVNNKGPMTQEEVGNILNISKMRVSQLERRALKRFRKKCLRFM